MEEFINDYFLGYLWKGRSTLVKKYPWSILKRILISQNLMRGVEREKPPS